MVEGFRRAAAVFGGGGGMNGKMLGSSAGEVLRCSCGCDCVALIYTMQKPTIAALAAEHSYAHRRAMQHADAEAAACLLHAQSTPPLAVAVVEDGRCVGAGFVILLCGVRR